MAKPRDHCIDPVLKRLEAERAREEAVAALEPPELLRGGHEAVRAPTADEVWTPTRDALVSTLDEPNMIAVAASEQRLEAALEAGVLPTALDAAVSANAQNSLEKMLTHQMAVAHQLAMKVAAQAQEAGLPPVERARLMNASARMMQAFQEGFLTLKKARRGGRQTVVVQHVHVTDGGQAVVAGQVKTRTGGHSRPGE
jgi:hypothetical protein